MTYADWRSAFADVLDTRLYSIEWLDAQVASGAAQVWTCDDAALLTEVRAYPTGGRVIHALIAAGNAERVADTLAPSAEAWGRANGCCMAVIESRPGWHRMMKRHGYRHHQTALRKEL